VRRACISFACCTKGPRVRTASFRTGGPSRSSKLSARPGAAASRNPVRWTAICPSTSRQLKRPPGNGWVEGRPPEVRSTGMESSDAGATDARAVTGRFVWGVDRPKLGPSSRAPSFSPRVCRAPPNLWAPAPFKPVRRRIRVRVHAPTARLRSASRMPGSPQARRSRRHTP